MASTLQILGQGYRWSRGDPLPQISELPGFSAGPTADHALLAELAGLSLAEVTRRVEELRSQPYLAWIDGTAAGYGWSARPGASLGAPPGTRPLPPDGRWLWDFATLDAWRGRGVYPRLLQAILTQETDANQFFIGHAAGNEASRRGILKAGFKHIYNRVLLPGGESKMVSPEDMETLEREQQGAQEGV